MKRVGLGTFEAGLSLAALSKGKKVRTRFFGGILGIDAYNRFFSKQAEMMNKIMETRDAVKKVEKEVIDNSQKLDRNFGAIKDNRKIIPSNIKDGFKNFFGRFNKDDLQEV